MAGRYLITGVQIGLIKVLINKSIIENRVEINKILKEKEDKQFVGQITQEGEKVGISWIKTHNFRR